MYVCMYMHSYVYVCVRLCGITSFEYFVQTKGIELLHDYSIFIAQILLRYWVA